jgi:hypothetical protein
LSLLYFILSIYDCNRISYCCSFIGADGKTAIVVSFKLFFFHLCRAQKDRRTDRESKAVKRFLLAKQTASINIAGAKNVKIYAASHTSCRCGPIEIHDCGFRSILLFQWKYTQKQVKMASLNTTSGTTETETKTLTMPGRTFTKLFTILLWFQNLFACRAWLINERDT